MVKFDPNRWSVGARSETGYVREENQDRMSWVRAPFGDVYIVSDGMGGVGDGALAAELTVQTLQQRLGALRHGVGLRSAVRGAFKAANEAVYARAHTEGEGTPGMGATAVAVVACAYGIMVAHVGDSRAYLFDVAGQCKRLTKDHSRVQHMVDSGVLTAAQAQAHPDANVIERAVGHAPRIEVEISSWLQLRNGDRIMVCSDGLCGYADDAEIAAVLRRHINPQDAADSLVQLALAKGGEDNITVQVILYQGDATEGRSMPPARWLAIVLTAGAVAAATVLASEIYQWPGRTSGREAAMQQQIEKLLERLREQQGKLDEMTQRWTATASVLQARVDSVEQELGRRRDSAIVEVPKRRPGPSRLGGASRRPADAGGSSDKPNPASETPD